MNTPHRPAVLIVDDDIVSAEIMAAMIEAEYEATIVADVDAAMHQLLTTTVDAILLDIVMDDTDGYEFCSILKRTKRTAEIPVIFVSALIGAEEEAEGFLRGADDYVTKPVNDGILKARLQRTLQTRLYVQFLENLVHQRETTIASLREEARVLLDK